LKSYLGDAVIFAATRRGGDQDRVSVRWLANPFSFYGAIFASIAETAPRA
jgi:hypothetical protein